MIMGFLFLFLDVPGAQTERRSDSGPVRRLLGGEASQAADFALPPEQLRYLDGLAGRG
jgi:hypothetical protein